VYVGLRSWGCGSLSQFIECLIDVVVGVIDVYRLCVCSISFCDRAAVALSGCTGVAPGFSGAVKTSFARAKYSSFFIIRPRWPCRPPHFNDKTIMALVLR
jgi:hypothetical protein